VPQAGVLACSDPVLDACVGAVAGFEEGQLPAGCVGAEGLVAVAVADLERVQRRPGVGQFAADDDAHAWAVLGPLAEVEQADDLHDVSVLTQVPVGVARDLPRPSGPERWRRGRRR